MQICSTNISRDTGSPRGLPRARLCWTPGVEPGMARRSSRGLRGWLAWMLRWKPSTTRGVISLARGFTFSRAVCESLPFADGSFDLVVAFEVIEHLARWQDFLTEARRVLRPAGLLLVSTPNKAYYAEARGAAGANPYHVREFEFRRIRIGFAGCVSPRPDVDAESFGRDRFQFHGTFAWRFRRPADDRPEQAHFFLAACSQSPIRDPRAFRMVACIGECSAGSRAAYRAARIRAGEEGRVAQAGAGGAGGTCGKP